MNKKYMYRKIKKSKDMTDKVLKQIILSAIIFVVAFSMSSISAGFKKIAITCINENADLQKISEITYEKIENCFKEYINGVDLK